MIAEYNGTTDCNIQPCHSNEFPSPVTRPSYSVLDKTKIKETFGIRIPYWTDSLKKCINKYNVIVYAIPETDCPLYYGNKGTAGDEKSNTSILVHYANPDWADYNVKMWGGKYKAQGSSAKKYLFHNTQYSKGTFLTEEQIAAGITEGTSLTEAEFAHNMSNNLKEGDEGYIAPRKFYRMPESDIDAKKFVGKVNYASSMQTHKQGACDLFDGAYKSIF